MTNHYIAANVYLQARNEIDDVHLREYALGNLRQAVSVGQVVGTGLSLTLPTRRITPELNSFPPSFTKK